MTLFRDRYRVESIRLPDWDYSSRGWYFVTLCTKDKKYSLGDVVAGQILLSQAGVIAEAELAAVPRHYENVIIDRYVVMPNHIHAIVVIEGVHLYSPVETGLAPSPLVPSPPAASPVRANARLPNIVGGYKAGVSRICHANGLSCLAWQSRFHDHMLRSNAAVNAVRDYIDYNPKNWLLDPEYSSSGPAEDAASRVSTEE